MAVVVQAVVTVAALSLFTAREGAAEKAALVGLIIGGAALLLYRWLPPWPVPVSAGAALSCGLWFFAAVRTPLLVGALVAPQYRSTPVLAQTVLRRYARIGPESDFDPFLVLLGRYDAERELARRGAAAVSEILAQATAAADTGIDARGIPDFASQALEISSDKKTFMAVEGLLWKRSAFDHQRLFFFLQRAECSNQGHARAFEHIGEAGIAPSELSSRFPGSTRVDGSLVLISDDRCGVRVIIAPGIAASEVTSAIQRYLDSGLRSIAMYTGRGCNDCRDAMRSAITALHFPAQFAARVVAEEELSSGLNVFAQRSSWVE